MNNSFTGRVVLCWPSKRSEIAELNQRIGPDQKFTPSIEHSLAMCDGCQRGIWIGPQQRQLVNSALVKARKLCLYCAADAQRVLQLDVREHNLNPDMTNARKRIA